MAWTAPIQHAVGDVLPASDWNTYVANNEIALENSLQVVGLTNAVIGTNAALGAPNFQIQAGTVVALTSSTGEFSITYPVAFPNSVLTAIAIIGDSTLASVLVTLAEASMTLATLYGYIWSGTTASASVNWRVNYIAIGS